VADNDPQGKDTEEIEQEVRQNEGNEPFQGEPSDQEPFQGETAPPE
jgi:hypothetical protein